MVSVCEINPLKLPSVALADRVHLPVCPCVYFAIDTKGVVQYVGRSINARKRWRSHHKIDEVSAIPGARIAYLIVDAALLRETEEAFIEWLSPPLNTDSGRAYDKKRADELPLCNRLPWAYLRGPGRRLTPDPAVWGAARGLIDRLLRGDSVASCLHWLRETTGVERSRAWVRMWTQNATLRGHTPYTIGGRTKAEKGVFKPTEIIYNTHPALISESEYRAILRGFVERRGRRGANQNATIYPVPGIVWCSCGRKTSPAIDPSGTRRHRCQWEHCPNRRPSTRDDAIEAAIQEAILEAAEAIAAAALTQDTSDPRIAALEAEAAALRPLARRAAIAAEIEAIELEVAQLKAAQGNQAAGEAEIRAMVQGLALTDWGQLSREERRAIYGAVVERVVVEGGEVLGVKVRGV